MPTHTTVTFAGSGVLVVAGRILSRTSAQRRQSELALRAAKRLEEAGRLPDDLRGWLRDLGGTQEEVARLVRADIDVDVIWRSGWAEFVAAFPSEGQVLLRAITSETRQLLWGIGRVESEWTVRRVVAESLGASQFFEALQLGRASVVRELIDPLVLQRFAVLDDLARGPADKLRFEIGRLSDNVEELRRHTNDLVPTRDLERDIDEVLFRLAEREIPLAREAVPPARPVAGAPPDAPAIHQQRLRAAQGGGPQR